MNLRTGSLLVSVLAFVGIVDALYLSLTHRTGPVPCHVTQGCEQVLTSAYSEIAGVPISWFGVAFYTVALLCGVFEWCGISGLRLLIWPATAAVLVSAVLVGIQSFVLNAFCEYCLLSASLSTGIAVTTWYAVARSKPTQAAGTGSGSGP